jgi:aminoglycoside phosphotransferase (APT) family kinase protein
MTDEELCRRLETFLSKVVGAPVQCRSAQRLSGGASRESWGVDAEVNGGPDAGLYPLVLRRDMGGTIRDDALSREQEFRVLQAAYRAGVRVPRPRWSCADSEVLHAPFFLMDRLEGETVGRRLVREQALAEARRLLPTQMGEQLARIHAIDPQGLDFLPNAGEDKSPAQLAVELAAAQLARFGEPHPVLELTHRWLRARTPKCPHRVLVHGDFRVGNLMVGLAGLVGVLDWEFAHVGDPAEDLAWPCVRAWRFGHDDLKLGGVGRPEDFIEAYERAGGQRVDPSAVAYWEVLGNFRWAVGCIAQADRHLSGQAPSVELASLGRRTAEMELELLDLIGS